MSDIYAQILEELPEGKRPTNNRGVLYKIDHTKYGWRLPPRTCTYLPCDSRDAHAHIRCAAEDFVREWCKSSNRSLTQEFQDGREELWAGDNFGDYVTTLLGSGPDLPHALLAALKYIKEHP